MGTQLTQEERQVFELLAHGRTFKEIAAELAISVEMVKEHFEHPRQVGRFAAA